ncbi:MAG TPA: radical SAM protein [Eggerthellaceae bacterium]|nr:radical SAM protein [Eggerthellaceae bacterium]
MPACATCPHACTPRPNRAGRCRARRADAAGTVVPEGYGRITSLALDPIEKKPIACWRGGTTVLSLGSYGCNMRCPFCQNASIAQAGAEDVSWREVQPSEVVRMALDCADRNCIGIAFTYNEPLVNWEFLRDTGTLAHKAGLANVLVSNGMASEGVLETVAPLVDAANIDLKCFVDEGYRSLGGDLPTVKRTIRMLAAQPGCHVEVTTLVVPGLSDDETRIDAAARWLAGIDPDIPYHLTRFFPQHQMANVPPTPRATLHRLRDVAARHLSTVLLGNI